MSNPPPAYPRRRTILTALAAVLIAGGAVAWWLGTRPDADGRAAREEAEGFVRGAAESAARVIDPEKLCAANNKGVGLMEQFDYRAAVPAFEAVVELAPDWLPGRINLGIALLNRGGTGKTPEERDRDLRSTRKVFEDVLRLDPDNKHAHHCLGVLLKYQKDQGEAIEHFEAVTRLDPGDPHAWVFLGILLPPGRRREECFRKALEADPYLTGALYQVMLQSRDPLRRKERLARFDGLRANVWESLAGEKYTEMGKYAEVIGRAAPCGGGRPSPALAFEHRPITVRLAAGARWAREADLSPLARAARRRFGGTIVQLDLDGDGNLDLFLASAVVENGKVRDLLLRKGKGGYTDVTAQVGLATPFATLGATVGDFDNDGKPDLLLTGANGVRLFRNTGGAFEDVTATAGMDKLTGVFLGAAFVDLDQDSDLDLVLARYADNEESALALLEGKGKPAGGKLLVFLNVGEAPPGKGDRPLPGLTCRWKQADLAGLAGGAAPIVPVVSDVDGDRDLDLLVLGEREKPVVVANDRLLRFRRLEVSRGRALPWNGALVLDADRDGRADLVLLAAGHAPTLWLGRSTPGLARPEDFRYEPQAVSGPPLRQAVAIDLDRDGWTDVVGLSDAGVPVWLRNEGGRLTWRPDGLGPAALWPKDLVALTVDPDPIRPALLGWSESGGLHVVVPRDNGHCGLQIRVLGWRGVTGNNKIRCTADGVGTWVAAQAGGLYTGVENTTLCAGLGQARLPVLLGLGKHRQADAVRLLWPDGTVQAELNVTACASHRITQNNRKPGSCPILFAWNGTRFAFVNDFLGAGSVGELGPDGTCRPPRGEESVKIEPHQLAPRDGRYLLALAEPMDEVTYLDKLQLVVIDHPAGTSVYPDERFATGGAEPTQELIAFDRRVFPVAARDQRGQDVTQKLRAWDRNTVDGFRVRAWLGFAEEHFVELDFKDRLSGFRKDERLVLCLAGWTDYPYPEAIWAANQAGVAMQTPILERQGEEGKWHKVADAGMPAGLPRMMLLDVTGKLSGKSCKLRLRTNLEVFWDQAFVAAGCRTVNVGGKSQVGNRYGPRATALAVGKATLAPCGVMQEYSPDGKAPTVYAFDRFESVPVVRLTGRLTRYGDVTPLLRAADDQLVLFGPGDLLTVSFDARGLPPLPAGWQRSFVLRTWGWCKDASPFTATGGTIEPLPFRAMRNYPPGPGDRAPDSAAYRDYRRLWNTREVKPD
jgi:hypothetical protein